MKARMEFQKQGDGQLKHHGVYSLVRVPFAVLLQVKAPRGLCSKDRIPFLSFQCPVLPSQLLTLLLFTQLVYDQSQPF